jgi:hypothetical protein
MAVDPNARKISIGFPGGSITATRGLLTAIFGPDLVAQAVAESFTVSRKSHSRVRVIGGASTSVAGTNYTRKRYGAAPSNGGAGGEAIAMMYQGDWWTARLSGSHQAFNDWLKNSTWASGVAAMWRSEKGTKYGPFVPPAPVV